MMPRSFGHVALCPLVVGPFTVDIAATCSQLHEIVRLGEQAF